MRPHETLASAAPSVNRDTGLEQLAAEVASLRGEVLRQRRRVRGLVAGLLALGAVGVGLGAQVATTGVDASAFRLVSDRGTLRASLALGADGNALLTFYDPEGKATRAIGQFDDAPERLGKVEAAVAGLQRHLIARDRAGAGLVLPERPDLLDDIRRDQADRDLEQIQHELRKRQLELEREADRRRIEMDELRREQDRRDLERRMRERSGTSTGSPFGPP